MSIITFYTISVEIWKSEIQNIQRNGILTKIEMSITKFLMSNRTKI